MILLISDKKIKEMWQQKKTETAKTKTFKTNSTTQTRGGNNERRTH